MNLLIKEKVKIIGFELEKHFIQVRSMRNLYIWRGEVMVHYQKEFINFYAKNGNNLVSNEIHLYN